MKYDFSKITTDNLKEAIRFYNQPYTTGCINIWCSNCPFSKPICKKGKAKLTRPERHKLFKEELDRRENKNTMRRKINTLEELRALEGKIITFDLKLGDHAQNVKALVTIQDSADERYKNCIFLLQNTYMGTTAADLKECKHSIIIENDYDFNTFIENIYYEEENPLPELKAGMLISEDNKTWYMVMPNPSREGFMFIDTKGYNTCVDPIINYIAQIKPQFNYSIFFLDNVHMNNITLICQRISENDIKKSKLEATLKELQEDYINKTQEIREQLGELN